MTSPTEELLSDQKPATPSITEVAVAGWILLMVGLGLAFTYGLDACDGRPGWALTMFGAALAEVGGLYLITRAWRRASAAGVGPPRAMAVLALVVVVATIVAHGAAIVEWSGRLCPH